MELNKLPLNEKIRYLRNEKGISQGQLSRLSGISVAEICRLEKGERQNPSVTLLNKLLKGLDADLETYLIVVGFYDLWERK